MANIDDAFRIDKLSLNDNILITEGSIDPSSTGYEANIGSLFFNSSTGAIFHKYGTADTDWNRFGEIDAAAIFAALKAPTGFVNRDTSTFDINTTTRIFTITPLYPASSFAYFIKGQKQTVTTSVSITLPDITNLYYVYFDGVQTLHYQNKFDETLAVNNCLVASVYWNADVQTVVYLGDERHGCDMDGSTHLYLHNELGSRYVSGLNIVSGLITNTDADASLSFNLSPGVIRSEDLTHSIVNTTDKVQPYDLAQTISPLAYVPVLYRLGSTGSWVQKYPDAVPFVYEGGTPDFMGYLVPFNQWDGSTWSHGFTDENAFVFFHLFATNDIRFPIVSIQGTQQYTTVPSGAYEAAKEIKYIQHFYDNSLINDLPFNSFVPLISVILQVSSTLANSYKAIVVPNANGINYIDWKFTNNVDIANTSITNHKNLTGLSHDDHTIYALAGGGSTRTFNIGDLYNVTDPTKTNFDTGKIFGVVWNNATAHYTISTIPLTSLSDVSIVEGASINNYSITWNNTISKWVATPSAKVLSLYNEHAISPTVPAALGINSIALGSGAQTSTSADNSLAIGNQSLARTDSSMVFASGRFGSTGDAQVGKYLLRTITINNTVTEAFIDGANGNIRLVLPDDATWSFSAMITAHQTNGAGRAGYKLEGVIYRVAGANTTAIQGRVLKTVLAESFPAWDINIVADAVNGALKVTAQGENSKNIRWVCSIDTVEITN